LFRLLSLRRSDLFAPAGLDLSPTPHDVRIFFPRVQDDGAELWTSSNFLSGVSHYFESLLWSGFAESVTQTRKRPRTRASTATPAPQVVGDADKRDCEGLDEETDRVYFERFSPRLHEHEGDCPLEYRQITITKTAFTTYRAVLTYL
jgi:hypothetical protein